MINHFKVYHYLKNIFHFTRTTVEPGLYPREFHDLQMIRRYRDFFRQCSRKRLLCSEYFFFIIYFHFFPSRQTGYIQQTFINLFQKSLKECDVSIYLYIVTKPFSIPSFVYKISTSLFSIIILCNLMPSVNNLSKSLFFLSKNPLCFCFNEII